MQRIVVTGVGAVTPIGIGREELWSGLRQNRVGICNVSRFDASALHCQVAGEVHGFEAERWIPEPALHVMDRTARFGAASAKMAIEDAGIELDGMDPARIGCFLGSGMGSVSLVELQLGVFAREHSLHSIQRSLADAVCGVASSGSVASELGITGPVSSNNDSCATGPIAIARAADAIRQGHADVMLAGATDAPLTRMAFGAFDLIRAMSTHYNETPEIACRPFDRGRDGFVMGEGAAVMVLESEEHARRRGATCLAEIAGFGLTNDGHHMTAPRPDAQQAERAMRLALDDAACPPEELDAISAHGSATPLNDVSESRAIREVLGERAYRIPVIGTKSRHAHSLGATGAIEATIFALGLYYQWLPGGLNLSDPDPGCDLDYAQSGPVQGPLRAILSNSFGFGGINACLVMRSVDTAGSGSLD